ncbi:ABC transporter permease [Streptomyces thermolilacinus]|uniref:Uncharacterized protein n=1 Tax=Streptomyces thermolilacinus SPC6 TaxID=1306406 RepID=A0A1D3DTM2_9ACTN|nr:ABC transporter permease [Streptomyces thermolilacinus]OEJ95667.1 hypothetical protein J116_015415 [Streptomyces thermolilacinus SPC6]
MTIWHVRAEWRKTALRPLTLLLFAILTVGCVTTAFYAQDYWSGNVNQAHKNLRNIESGESYRSCLELNPKLGPEYCRGIGEMERRSTEEWVADSREKAAEAARAQTVPGAFGWAAQAFASFPGLVVVLLLAAQSMGAEYDNRTAGNLLLADPRTRTHILAKATALWLTTATALCCAGAAVAVFGLVKGRSDYPLHAFHLPPGEDLLHGLRLWGGALVVTAVWSVIAVALTALARNQAGGIARSGAVLVLLMLGSGAAGLWGWLPGGIVADVMAFHPGDVLWNVWWGPEPGSPVPLAVRALPTVLITALGIRWIMRAAGRGNEVT